MWSVVFASMLLFAVQPRHSSCWASAVERHDERYSNKSSAIYYTAMDQGDLLATVDQRTGNVTSIRAFSQHGVTSLDFDNAANTMFGLLDGKILAQIDENSGTMRVVGKTGLRRLRGLGISPEGDLYTYSSDDSSLYLVDRNQGAIRTKLFDTGAAGIVDVAYSVERRVVYATDGAHLYIFDPSQRRVENLGNIQGLSSSCKDDKHLSGIAFDCDGSALGLVVSGGRRQQIYRIELRTSPPQISAGRVVPKSNGFAVKCNDA